VSHHTPKEVSPRRILVGDKEMVVIFAPPREDFLTSEVPAYMRKG
jgi:hypothetical protein